MFARMLQRFARLVRTADLFSLCLAVSVALHGLGYAAYQISRLPSAENGEAIELADIDIDFEDLPPEIPPELFGGDSNPAPVEKQEWVEGASKDAMDAEEEDIHFNALSGDGTDKDGYLYSIRGDSVPSPYIDFDLRRYFPREAKRANITRKTVMMRVQVDEYGKLQSARIVSGRAGYGFDEAAMEIIRRARFRPGYLAGRPTRMSHRIPITFVLEE
jgi:protein TonB